MKEMKIGLITFHRAINHGAVLQTYASIEYVRSQYGLDIEVIDYWPKKRELGLKKLFSLNRPKIMYERFKNYFKGKKIAEFRNKNLPMSKRYYSNAQLLNECIEYDVLFCGSDQIWNPSYFLHGDGRNVTTPVYFLNFGGDNVKRVALSASFGCVEYPIEVGERIKPYIEKFDAISVRENTGIEILKKLGCDNAVVTADPTSLLDKEQYKNICENCLVSSGDYVALSILRSQNSRVKGIVKSTEKLLGIESVNIVNYSIENWLAGIRDAKVVVTNSFHCVMMCLKLHTPFFVVTEKIGNQGMNDRFYTLLELFDMTDRIIEDCPNSVKKLPKLDINWQLIDDKMQIYSNSLKSFLDDILEGA